MRKIPVAGSEGRIGRAVMRERRAPAAWRWSAPPGHEACYIAAPEIRLDAPVEALLARHFPGDCPVPAEVRGSASPVSCEKARRLPGREARGQRA